MPDWSAPHDPLGAFCRDNHAERNAYARGPLSELTFAAKDAFHIEGVRTGFRQPDWLRTHRLTTVTARAIALLLEAGALPFGPSFDAAGWLARSSDVFERVGRVLLGAKPVGEIFLTCSANMGMSSCTAKQNACK